LQEDVTTSVDPDTVRLETAIASWGVRVVEVEYKPGHYTFEKVSVERRETLRRSGGQRPV
jgi:hypothetical protein